MISGSSQSANPAGSSRRLVLRLLALTVLGGSLGAYGAETKPAASPAPATPAATKPTTQATSATKPAAQTTSAAKPAAQAVPAKASTPAARPAAPAVTTSKAATPTATAASVINVTATYENFRLIADRNIFNPNRYARSGRTGPVDDQRPSSDIISFVGTLVSDKALYAFFDSADGRYRKVLPVGGSIVNFTVKKITTTGVELARDDKAYPLRVSQQLLRDENGETWSAPEYSNGTTESPAPATGGPGLSSAAPVAAAPVPASAASSASAEPAAAVPAATPTNSSDTLKRLMEQRQKQLQ